MAGDNEATLVIDVRGMPIDATPRIEVRDDRLRLVERVRVGEPAVLAAGRYVVRVRRPDGSHDAEIVDLATGEERSVLLAGVGADRTRDRTDIAALSARSSFAGSPHRDDDGEADHERGLWYARVVSGATGELIPVEAPVSEGLLNLSKVYHSIGLTFRLPEFFEGTPLVQVARHGMVPLCAALPGTADDDVRVRVDYDEGKGRLGVSAAPGRAHERSAVLAAYLAQGYRREAREVAELVLDTSDPVEQVLSALVRGCGPADPTVTWSFGATLPDSFVLAAEQRLGSSTRSQVGELYEEALSIGVPVFSDVAAILARRLLEGWGERKAGWLALARLVAERAEIGTLTTTFIATDPADPSAPLTPVEDFEGWFAFRREEQLQFDLA